MSLEARFVNYICLKYICASKNEGSLKGGTILQKFQLQNKQYP